MLAQSDIQEHIEDGRISLEPHLLASEHTGKVVATVLNPVELAVASLEHVHPFVAGDASYLPLLVIPSFPLSLIHI